MQRALPLSLIVIATVATVAPGLSLTAGQPNSVPASTLKVDPIDTPAGPQSGQPHLAGTAEGVLLSWVERVGESASLRFSERSGGGWSAPRTVASGTNWFVNWADVPSVTRLRDRTLVAHWLQKSGPDTYAYDVRLSYSKDDGRSWQAPFLPHQDGTKTEHGFVSLFDAPESGLGTVGPRLGVVWLDGRGMTGGHGGHDGAGDMALRFTTFDRQWAQSAEMVLDGRVCECCPTSVAQTDEGPIVAYRDRSANEVRDIFVTRLSAGRWSEPVAVHHDDWRVPACPVNGPAISARGRDVAVAWFSAKGDQPKSFVAFSRDAGRTFGPPVRLDDEASLGRVDLELLPDGSAIAAYVEFAAQRGSFRVRRVDRNGARSAPVTVAGIAGNRTSGMPRMVLRGNELFFAWVDREAGSIVRTAKGKYEVRSSKFEVR